MEIEVEGPQTYTCLDNLWKGWKNPSLEELNAREPIKSWS